MSGLVKLFSRKPTSLPKERRPFARRLSRYAARSFRGDAADVSPADVLPEYKPRSVFEEHRGIAIFFGIICIGLAAYWIKSVLAGPKAPPPQSVYIEMVPPSDITPQAAPIQGSAQRQ